MLKSKVYSSNYTEHPGIYSAGKRKDNTLFCMLTKNRTNLKLKKYTKAPLLHDNGFLYCFVFIFTKFDKLMARKSESL